MSYNLKIENQVKFLGYRDDVSEIYKISDLFVFPSYREGLSLSLMEAMASGMKVVCSKIRGNIDLIEENKGGFLVDPNDINGFSEAILKAMHSGEKMGCINSKTVKNYDLAKVKDSIIKIYKMVQSDK